MKKHENIHNALFAPSSNLFDCASIPMTPSLALFAPKDSPPRQTVGFVIEPEFRPPWLAQTGRFSLPCRSSAEPLPAAKVILRFEQTGQPALVVDETAVHCAFDPVQTLQDVLGEKYFTSRRPWVSRLPFHYHRFPGAVRFWAQKFRAVQKAPAGSGFPQWPCEPGLEAFRWVVSSAVLAASGRRSPDRSGVWPKGKKFAVALSHDLDTARSLAAVPTLARIEQDRGLVSCWNIVGRDVARAESLCSELTDAGHEIGLHGYLHDNRLAYLSFKKIEQRLNGCQDFLDRHQVVGFRSPSLITSDALDRVVADRFAWSSSTIDTDANSIIAPRRGSGSVFPFFKGALLEIPLTVPLDDRLLLMGFQGERLLDLVEKKIDWISQVGGVAFLGNHPEPHLSGSREMILLYEKILDRLLERKDAWFALPSRIARHWRALTSPHGNAVAKR